MAKFQASRDGLQRFVARAFVGQSLDFYRLLGITLFLLGFGIVMVLSASSIDSLKANDNSFAIFGRQALWGVLGVFTLAGVSLVPMSFFKRHSQRAFMFLLVLQLAVFFIGKDVNGNRNWIVLGPISIQPSEFLKIALVMQIAVYISRREQRLDEFSTWKQPLIWLGMSLFLVMIGKDLGTSLIIMAMVLGQLALAGMPGRTMRGVVVLMAVAIPIALTLSSSRIPRILAWLNPGAPDPNGYNWQSEHGMWALAAGGIFGSGLGNSKMKWSWIPEVENDFIFAVIGEELGLIGAAVVIAMFVGLAVTFVRIMNRTHDAFSRHLIAGILFWIVPQAFVNIAVVLRLLPVLGVPLPLISAGGSSLVASLGSIGIILAIERNNHLNPAPRAVRAVRLVK